MKINKSFTEFHDTKQDFILSMALESTVKKAVRSFYEKTNPDILKRTAHRKPDFQNSFAFFVQLPVKHPNDTLLIFSVRVRYEIGNFNVLKYEIMRLYIQFMFKCEYFESPSMSLLRCFNIFDKLGFLIQCLMNILSFQSRQKLMMMGSVLFNRYYLILLH